MSGPDWRRAAVVARTELRRTRRTLKDSARGVLMLVGGVLLVPTYSLGIGAMAYFGADAFVGHTPGTARTATIGGLAGLVALVGFVELQRSAKQIGEPDGLDGLLTTAPYGDVLAGVLLAEFARGLGLLALPVLALAGGLAAGAGSLALGTVVLLVSLLAVAFGLLAGYAGGLAVKLVAARSEFVARHRASVGSAASLLLVAGWIGLSSVSSVQTAAVGALAGSPVARLADIVLLAAPDIEADPAMAAVGGAALLGSVPVAAVACQRLAERVWYGDPVQPDHEFDADERPLSDRLLDGRVPTATRVVAQKSWQRAKRSPFTVQFALAPFVLLAYQGTFLLRGEPVPATLPLTGGLACGAAFGAAFTLNPLGGEERVLPLTLTANVSGRAFVSGLVLAGALPGVVATAALVAVFGVAAGTGPLALAAALTASLLAAVAAPPIAAGCGVVFPKFERSSVQGRETVVPSSFAFGTYAVVFGAVVAPTAIAYVVAVDPPFAVPVGTTALLGGGIALTAVLAGAAAVAGFLYAADRIATYRLP